MFLAEQFRALIFTPTLFFDFFSSLSSSYDSLWYNGDHLAHNGHNPTTYGPHQRSVIPRSHALLLFRFRVKRLREAMCGARVREPANCVSVKFNARELAAVDARCAPDNSISLRPISVFIHPNLNYRLP